MCLEGSDHLEGLGEDADEAIVAAEEHIFRARTHSAETVALARLAYWSFSQELMRTNIECSRAFTVV